jgi:putative ABC transport system permease protein
MSVKPARFATPLAQDAPLLTFLIVRPEVAAAGVEQAVHHAVRSLNGDVVVTDTSTLGELLSSSVAEPRFRTALFGMLSGAALILAAIRVYGVLVYSVVQRTHEIGVRVALGGQRRDILRLVMVQGLQVTLVGLSIGVAISIGLTFVLRGLLFQVQPTDPVTLIGVAVLLGLTAIVACYAPARRATRIDAMVALRYE